MRADYSKVVKLPTNLQEEQEYHKEITLNYAFTRSRTNAEVRSHMGIRIKIRLGRLLEGWSINQQTSLKGFTPIIYELG